MRKKTVEVFGATSTTEEVLTGVNLHGKRILVTGVSAGIGVETARSLAAHGAQVVGAARNLAKAKTATAQVLKEGTFNVGSFELIELDLADLKSVRRCADALLAKGEPFDVVIANLEDPNFVRTPYEPFVAYGRSKTANILFAVAFDRRHRGNGIRAAAVHPGGIQTELDRHLDPVHIQKTIEQMNKQLASEGKAPFQLKTIPQGAATSVWAAVVAPADEVGGQYCENCHVGKVVPDDVTITAVSEGVRGYAVDPTNAEALWKKSEEMVGESF